MPTALIIGYVWPEASSSAAGVRTESLIEMLRSRGWEVVFASGSRENAASLDLVARGIRAVPVSANDPAFDSFIASLRPEAVIFDRFVTEEQFGWRVREHSPGTLRVLDTQDLHFLRRGRERALVRAAAGADLREETPYADLSRLEPGELVSQDTLRELAAIHRSDLTLVLSDFEEALLRESLGVPSGALELVRFAYPHAEGGPPFESRRGFAFVGNFRHAPNADAVRWLRGSVWPRVRKALPRAIVRVHGAYPSRDIMAMDSAREGFRVLGPVADLGGLLGGCRVNLAPLRFGAGIKGKIAEGWRRATPAVATSVAAEGMCGGLPFGGEVSDGAARFAESAVRLHVDRDAWGEASARGMSVLAAHYRFDDQADRLDRALRRRHSGLEVERRRNLLGAILWHQSIRATEYFSRWIEAKARVAGAGEEASAQRPEPPAEDPTPPPGSPPTSFTPSLSPVTGS